MKPRLNPRKMTQQEQIIFANLALIGGLLTPVFLLTWKLRYSNLPFFVNVIMWSLGFSYIGLYLLSRKSKYVNDHINILLYIDYFFSSIFTVYVASLNGFSYAYTLLIIIVVLYISLTFNNMVYLTAYMACVLLSVFICSYNAGNYTGNNVLAVVLVLVFLCIVSLVNLYLRLKFQQLMDESYMDYERLLDNSLDGIIVHRNYRILYANDTAVKNSGLKNSKELLGKSITDIVVQCNLDNLKTITSKGSYIETAIKYHNGHEAYIEYANTATIYKGQPSIMTVFRDISDRKRMEDMLLEAETKYRSLVEGNLIGVYLHQNNRLLYANPFIENITGYKPEELYNMDVWKLAHELDWAKNANSNIEIKEDENEFVREQRIIKKDGSRAVIQLNGKRILYKGTPAFMGAVIDITERINAQEKIEYMAYHDPLTGLPNRHQLENSLNEALNRCRSKGTQLALMFIDLDRFKIVNDSLGHKSGDILLTQASQRLSTAAERENAVFRYGGDEFIILLEEVTKISAEASAQKIINAFSEPFYIKGHEISVTPSIGISLYKSPEDDAETLLRKSDAAMYVAKTRGKNNYQFHTDGLYNSISRSGTLEKDLKRSLENSELILCYQPKVHLDTGSIYGAEALVRWNHPKLGLISPLEFIPLAEETGAIIQIGKWALETACRQCSEWLKDGLTLNNISVNVSSRQLNDINFVDTLSHILDETGLPPNILELEITESMIRNIINLKKTLDTLKPIGIKISIDDFGKGYSSLEMLQHISVDTLKIDRSFIKGIGNCPKASAIIKTIISIGQNLDFKLVAEGIENKAQLEFLKNSACDFGQGYLFSKPLDPVDFEKLLKSEK